LVGQVLEPDGRDLNMDVHTVHERPGNSPPVAVNLGVGAPAFPFGIA
jgi:hypothetical protein